MSGPIEDRLKSLRGVPEIDPPAELEARTLAAMAAAAAARPGIDSRRLATAAAWVAAVGAGLVLAGLGVNRHAAEATSPAVAQAEADYRELSEQSARLDRLLAELPQRSVMRFSTAGTIVGLEDRIAMIDSELARAQSSSLDPQYRAALMRNRVDVMNALVTVRYVQSPAFTY